MNGNVQKKGMSKGCLVALIVVGALLLIFIIAGITCYFKREDIAKYGTTVLITQIKQKISEQPIEGVDTVQFNAVADAFVTKLKETKLDYQKFGPLMQVLQQFQSDMSVDSADVAALLEEMVKYSPDLEHYLAPAEPTDTTMSGEDSIGGE